MFDFSGMLAMNGSRSSSEAAAAAAAAGNYPGYVPISSQPGVQVAGGVVTKIQWPTPNGVHHPHPSYFEFPDPQEYGPATAANVYHHHTAAYHA